MSRRPIPPHGSEARYKGTRFGRPPCRCKLCTRANRLAGIRRARARAAGEELLVSCDILLPHVQKLQASGMSQALIARRAGISQTTVSYIINGVIRSCQRGKALGLLAVQPGQFDERAERPAIGACRRARALYAIGHGRESISATCGLSVCTIGQIANGRYNHIDGRIDAAIRLAYRTLGDTPGPSRKAIHRAASQQWAPVGAWDDDRIDDPAATPDWTGHCGSDRGFWMHRNQKLPMCARCETAHTEWLAERVDLAPRQLNREKFQARSAAASREADLAHDARELMRFGADTEQAATRLRVTRQHLQQALLRHPEDTTPQQDDMEAAA
ncbi:helix-turn-helix domain-containing protein [Streptomyces canus]|uniref:helix-turn-helix domain-containing protein n=1 Tax=Streptomyces canus TaxID=58343 RepID=UPI003247774B